MLRVGLTGSIAVGKTYVCDIFAKLGCFILDADQTAREVVEPNTEGLRLIIENFGNGILQENGTLDRRKLGAIVFSDTKKRQLLNSIVHPLVIESQDKWLKEREIESPRGIAIVDAALMVESGGYKRFDKLIVVWCDPDIQLKRLMLRDNLAETEAAKRVKTQMPQEEKKSFADFLIDTSDDFETTRAQAKEVYDRLNDLLKSETPNEKN